MIKFKDDSYRGTFVLKIMITAPWLCKFIGHRYRKWGWSGDKEAILCYRCPAEYTRVKP